MLASLSQFLPDPRLEDTGLPHQLRLFEHLSDKSGHTTAVLDARDLLEDPRRILGLLCEELRVPFTDKMLSWEPGLRQTDGAWARYWYDQVAQTTTFELFK